MHSPSAARPGSRAPHCSPAAACPDLRCSAPAPQKRRFLAVAARLCPRERSSQNLRLPGDKTAPPTISSQTRGAAKTQLPATARGAAVDLEVTHSSIQVPSSSPSARSSTPLTFKSKLAASSPAKILLTPFIPTGVAAASSPEPRAVRPALLRTER